MNEDIIFTLVRLLTCATFAGAGLYKLFHRPETIKEMTDNKVPFPALALWPVLAVELVGSVFLASNSYVWAVALAWIAFTVVATPFYHLRMYTPDGQFIFPQLAQTIKNLNIVGGLLALILLDPATPPWLVSRGLQ